MSRTYAQIKNAVNTDIPQGGQGAVIEETLNPILADFLDNVNGDINEIWGDGSITEEIDSLSDIITFLQGIPGTKRLTKMLEDAQKNPITTLTETLYDKNGVKRNLGEFTTSNGVFLTSQEGTEESYGAAYGITNYVNCEGLAIVKYSGFINPYVITNVAICRFYDENKTYIAHSAVMFNDGESTYEKTITIPQGAKYVRFSCENTATEFTITTPDSGMGEAISKALEEIRATIKHKPLYGIFHHWGFVGDSLMSGELAQTGDYQDRYAYSWAQRLVAMIGQAEGTNWSKGGLKTADWLSTYWTNHESGWTYEGRESKVNADKKQAYVICLGTNDAGQSVAVNTFDTNYKAIITHIKSVNADAKIFVVTIPKIWQPLCETNGYNDKIRALSSMSNVYVVDLHHDIPELTTDELDVYMNLGHMTTTGYQWLAGVMAELIDKCVQANISSFKWVGKMLTTTEDKDSIVKRIDDIEHNVNYRVREDAIAEPYVEGQEYNVGDLMMWNGYQYRCTIAHQAGEGNPDLSKFIMTSVSEEYKPMTNEEVDALFV